MIDAVGRNAFSGPHQNAVAGKQRRDRNPGELAVRIEPVRELRFHAREIAGEQRGSCRRIARSR